MTQLTFLPGELFAIKSMFVSTHFDDVKILAGPERARERTRLELQVNRAEQGASFQYRNNLLAGELVPLHGHARLGVADDLAFDLGCYVRAFHGNDQHHA